MNPRQSLTFLALFWLGLAQATEVIPGKLFFNPPPFLEDRGAVDHLALRSYDGRDNANGKSYRSLMIATKPVWVGEPRPARQDETAVRGQMLAHFTKFTTNGANFMLQSSVTNAVLGGQRALAIGYALPETGRPGKVWLYCVEYWTRYESNTVITVNLAANSPQGLQSLRECLAGLRILDR